MALIHAKPGEAIPLGSKMADPNGARTAALIKTDRFEAVRLVVPAGAVIPTHKVGGFLTLYCVEGHSRIELDSPVDLRPGDWMYLDRDESHAVRGIEDSVLLLTILFD